jgi:Membrane bound O-acyl transferase family
VPHPVGKRQGIKRNENLLTPQTQDWPPFFGPLRSCTTVGFYWGSYWQQTLHNSVMDFGYFLGRALRVPRRTPLALFIYLTTSFALSGFFHAVTWANLGPYPSNEFVIERTMKFFLAQVVGVMAEDLVNKAYRGLTGDVEPKVWKRVLGYVWVWCWLFVSGRPFGQVIVRTDMPYWKAPLPVIEWLLGEKY